MRTRLHLAVVLSVIALAGCGTTTSPVPVASPASPLASATSTPVVASPPSQPPATMVPSNEPSMAAPSPAPPPVLATAFTLPVPPTADAAWAAIQWRKLAPSESLGLIHSVLRWRGGFIAVEWGASSSPVWTSRDGAHWGPLRFNTATTFRPDAFIVGVAEVRTGLVALTMLAGPNDCSGGLDCRIYKAPLVAWTSPDGETWTPHQSPDLGPLTQQGGAPIVAAGPAGLVVTSGGYPSYSATSVDGIHWQALPARALPTGFTIRGIVGTATGFTAVGSLPIDADHVRAVTLQSVDGATWTGPYPLHLVSDSGVILASSSGESWGANGLVAARNGFIAVGGINATPGETLWWQSANGRDWRALPNWPPLGPTSCNPGGEGCGTQPNGTLVGDGHRLLALRGGADPGVWASTNGLVWSRLPVTGDIPSEEAMNAVMMPGGVLLSDRTTTWFGEAGGK